MASTAATTDAASAAVRQRVTLRRSATTVESAVSRRAAGNRRNPLLDRRQKVARRLDLRHRFGERGQARLPGADRLLKFGLAQQPRRERRALGRVERAQGVFRRGKIVVGVRS